MLARLKRLSLPAWSYPLLLLGLAVLAYGLLIPWLGYYWDEWPLTWIGHRLGSAGLERYFSTNRPFWGLLYRFTMPILGVTPWHWQVFGLFWRWLSAVLFWAVIRRSFPHRPELAAGNGVLFLLYPGFGQQSGGLMYGHFFIVLSAYLGSLLASLVALKAWVDSKPRFYALTCLALVLSLINLFSMEYFFLLELLRPFLIGAGLQAQSSGTERGARTRQVMRLWLPYLGLFIAAVIWRAFFFPYQTQNYQTGLLEQVASNPAGTLLMLAWTVLKDLYTTTLGAILQAFAIPTPAELGIRSFLVYAAVVLAAAAVCFSGLWLLFWRQSEPEAGRDRKATPLAFIRLAAPALLLAGVPFWVTQLPIGLSFPSDRFTLPFMAGAALLITGLLALLPVQRVHLLTIISLIAGLGAGLHFQEASAFRRDWNQQRQLFWQMSWRIPALQPGTTLVSSDLPLNYYSDNSLAGPLNWIYSGGGAEGSMDYMFYYASIRSERKLLFRSDQQIDQDYLAASFHGSTGQLVALVFSPPACMRILDANLDPENYMISALMRQAADITSDQWILPVGVQPESDLTPAIFGAEPAHNWCYYYEKASLAASQKNWEEVVRLGETAFSLGDYPNDPMERLPFIEGYAHTGQAGRALELSGEAAEITPLMQPILCRLWRRIDGEPTPSPELAAAANQAQQTYCQ